MKHEHPHNDLVEGIIQSIADKKKGEASSIRKKLAQQQPKMIRWFWDELDQTLPSHQFQGMFHCYECGEFSLETQDPVQRHDGLFEFTDPQG